MPTKEQARNIGSRFFLKIFYFLFFTFYTLATNAQCAMCRASLESEGNKTKAEAVNDGIVLLMAVPYIIVGLIGFAIYRMYFNKNKNVNS